MLSTWCPEQTTCQLYDVRRDLMRPIAWSINLIDGTTCELGESIYLIT